MREESRLLVLSLSSPEVCGCARFQQMQPMTSRHFFVRVRKNNVSTSVLLIQVRTRRHRAFSLRGRVTREQAGGARGRERGCAWSPRGRGLKRRPLTDAASERTSARTYSKAKALIGEVRGSYT